MRFDRDCRGPGDQVAACTHVCGSPARIYSPHAVQLSAGHTLSSVRPALGIGDSFEVPKGMTYRIIFGTMDIEMIVSKALIRLLAISCGATSFCMTITCIILHFSRCILPILRRDFFCLFPFISNVCKIYIETACRAAFAYQIHQTLFNDHEHKRYDLAGI